MAVFFIDTEQGRVATGAQLVAARVIGDVVQPPRPWFRIQGTGDATTMWYVVLRKRTRGVFLGALALRHGQQHATLLGRGWDEVPIPEIGAALEGAERS